MPDRAALSPLRTACHKSAPGLFLLTSVGIVAMYGAGMRVPRMRRHGLGSPDDPDLGRPSR